MSSENMYIIVTSRQRSCIFLGLDKLSSCVYGIYDETAKTLFWLLLNFFGSNYFSQINTMTMHNKLWQKHRNVQIPKNLTPWRVSNRGSSVQEVDAMTTKPRREGYFF
jgi:hypothetical protein